MRKLLSGNAWLAALVSWAGAVVLVTAGYGIWIRSQGEPFSWLIMRDAAFMAAPLALFRAWRDSRTKQE